MRAFSHRSFSLGSVDDFSVVAAPAAKGRICYLDSVGGDRCIDAFRGGAGMSEGYRRVNGGNLSTTARHNVFEFVVPQGAVISTYTLTREDGSMRTEPWPAIGPG